VRRVLSEGSDVVIVLDPRHVEAELRAAIRRLLDVPEVCDLLGRRARERALERFTVAANLDRLFLATAAATRTWKSVLW
jgi:hypothetical protein